ncbi:uncharacterized protein LOC108605944 [Drosophila busckii]|uniref:uncharacterized protein LOC108605944 n=1 Tax=Drosophila busckii TaxID=30019 RepID=UPI00083EAB98|nr:uncharacterized protein LOC108605944 [Drosophila busckii]
MEARRRRASAMSSAAATLPSTQDKEFNLRLVELYGQHECLWNPTLAEHSDVELKQRAWDAIASELGAHLTAAFVRSRISSLRYRLNVHKLQLLEHKMAPASSKAPQPLYYMEQFSFLDSVPIAGQQSGASSSRRDSAERLRASTSIASMFKQRLQQQQPHLEQLPQVLQRLNLAEQNAALVTKPPRPPSSSQADGSLQQRMQRLSALERGGSGSFRSERLSLSIPSVVKKRMRQQLPLYMQAERCSLERCSEPSKSYAKLPEARPGDSVSKTQMVASTSAAAAKSQRGLDAAHSDEEDLLRLHWNLRQQQQMQQPRARRPGGGPSLDSKRRSC